MRRRARRQWTFGAPILLAILTMLLLSGCSVTGSGGGWQASGPKNSHVISLAVTPNEPTKIYAGTDSSGAYYSDTGGQSWIGPGKGIPANAAISALLPDPVHIGTVYAATNAGIYISKDSARTWTKDSQGLPANDAPDALALTSNGVLLAGTESHGVFASQNDGQSWTASSNGLPANADVYTLMADPSDNTIWAGLVGQGVYQSQDNGNTWAAVTNGLPSSMDVFAFLAAPQMTNTIVVGTSLGAFVTTNDGQTWAARNNGLGATRVLSLASDPLHSGQFYAGTDNGVYETIDAGKHWGQLSHGLPSDEHVAAVVTGDQEYTQVLAAAGQVYRFPGGSLSSGRIFTFIIAGIFLLALLLLWQRQARIVKQMTPPAPPPKVPENPLLRRRTAQNPSSPQRPGENPLLRRKTEAPPRDSAD
jgi:ligand-binding sensor domain-containing protein